MTDEIRVAEGATGRGADNKTPVAVALERPEDGNPGHVAIRAIESLRLRFNSARPIPGSREWPIRSNRARFRIDGFEQEFGDVE